MRRAALYAIVPVLLSGWPVFRFLGYAGLVAYWVFGSGVVLMGVTVLRARPPESWLSPRRAHVAVGVVLVLYAAVFLVIYPIADSGRVGGGSDRDDALTQAASRWLRGESPYAEPTYLGRPISPLPGGLILSMPWVALFGNAAYQNLFWLLILYFVLIRLSRSVPMAACLFVLVTALSPAVQHELMTGGDLLANSLAVTTVAVLVGLGGGWLRGMRLVGLAALSGLVLAWRANFLLLLPILVSRIARRTGHREAAAFAGIALGAAAAAVVPVWFWDPEHFTPLRTYYEIGYLDSRVPHFGWAAVGAMAALSVGLALKGAPARWLRHGALVQGIPILAGSLLVSFVCPWCAFSFLQFGLMPLFLWVGDLVLNVHPPGLTDLAGRASAGPRVGSVL